MNNQPELFEVKVGVKTVESVSLYELFDTEKRRVIFNLKMTANQADSSNEHYKKSLCPHLQYRLKQSKSYTITR